MLKYLRRTCWFLFALAVSLVVVFLTMSLNSYRDRIEAMATDALGEQVHVKGDIKFGIMAFRPALVLKEISLGEGDGNIKAGKLTVAVQSPMNFLAHVRRLSIGDYVLGDYDVPVKLSGAGFDASGLSGSIDGGDLKGDASYLDEKLHLSLNLENLPYQKLAEGMTGKVKGKLLLDGKGADSVQILRSLNGTLRLEGGEGTLTSKAINAWTRSLLTSILPGGKDRTKLNCAVADFKIEKGIAQTRALVVDTSEVVIIGKGSVNLNTQQVDLLLRPKSKGMTIAGVATPVRVTGPWDDVTVAPVAEAVAKKIGGFLLTTINPAAALIPLMEMGSSDDGKPCGVVPSQEQKPADANGSEKNL